MPARTSFDYAVLRIVPRPDREEFVNAGVILFCLQKDFLAARIHVDESRLKALWPEIDVETITRRLEAFPKICAGDPEAGPIARLTKRERFHWLAAPRSASIQVSPVHGGLCDDPGQALDQLFRRVLL